MNQSKLESFIESMMNTLSGFVISWMAWAFVVAPLFNLPVDVSQSFWITFIFTFISLGRNYLVRRFFVKGFHQKAVELAKRITMVVK